MSGWLSSPGCCATTSASTTGSTSLWRNCSTNRCSRSTPVWLGRGSMPRSRCLRSGLRVEGLGGEFVGAAAPELHFHEDLVAVSLEGVEGDQGEAVLRDRLLVDGLGLEHGGGGDGAADQRSAPDQGDRSGPPVLAAPAPDHVVVEVDPPVGVVLGEDVGEVGLGGE